LAILAVLAAAGPKGLPRERLELLFWPDSDSERAKGSLKQTLYALRRDSKSADLIIGTSHLRLNSDVITSDIAAFVAAISERRLADAVALYHGPFMDGVEFPRLDELDRLITREREGLADKFRSVAETLASDLAKSGRYSEAAELLGRLAHSDPYSSQIALKYVDALARAGERERAIKHAAVHEKLLKHDLGAEAGPEISSLVAQLKAGKDPNGASPGSAPLSREPVAAIRPAIPDNPDTVNQVAIPGRGQVTRPAVYSTLALLAIAGAAFLGMRLLPPHFSDAALPEEAKELVVLPLENETGDPQLNVLGAMSAEWITEGIARSAILPVIDPGSAAAASASLLKQHSGRAFTIGEITKATGASDVVTGDFYRRGDSLEFHARIVDGKTGKVLATISPVSAVASDPSVGIGQLRTQVMSVLAKAFDARFAQVTMSDAIPPKFDAYREFAEGVDMWASDIRMGEADSLKGDPYATTRAHFRRAYALDTTFVTPLVWTLFTYSDLLDVAKPLLDSLIERSDRLTPLDRYAVDYFEAELKQNNDAALRAAEHASDLAPRSEWSWIAGQLLFPRNRPRETLKYFSRLDPDAGWMRLGWEYYWYLRAQTTHQLGDLPGTYAWLARARKKFPENIPIAAAYARALALNGERDSMMVMVDEILQSSVDWRAFYVYSIIEDLRRHERQSEAVQVFRALAGWYASKGSAATEDDRRFMAQALLSMKLDRAAEQHFRRLIVYFPASFFRKENTAQLAVILARRGDSAGAFKLLESIPREQQQYADYSYWRSRVAAELGQRSAAVELLRKAFNEGYPQISLSHSVWFDFPKLQAYPAFENLVGPNR
jgi:DNA-binding SARP family transcriptional activator/TolB-like protein